MTNIPKQGRYRIWLGKGLLIAGAVSLMVLRFVPSNELGDAFWVLMPLPTLMIITGCLLYWRGRQYRAKARAATVLSDSVPDVLYLRAFGTDPSTARHIFSSLLTQNLFSGLATIEEQLGDVLQPFGDLVAIGKPGESLPLPGAARMYASDAEWKELITAQMKTARLVVIRAGSTEGLLWELQESVRMLDPGKLLILVLSMKPKALASFKTQADRVLPVPLPPNEQLRAFQRRSGFIWFSPDWTPILLPLRAPFFRRSPFKPLRQPFKFTLKPLFEEFGLKWTAPPVSAAMVAAMSLLGIFGLLPLLALVTVVAHLLSGHSTNRVPVPVAPLPSVASVPAKRGLDSVHITPDTSSSPPTVSASAAWKTFTVKELTLEAPADLRLGPTSPEELPPEIANAVESFETFTSGIVTRRLLNVSRSEYKPGFELSLDGAMNGGMAEAAKLIDDPNPQLSSKETTVDGLPARRASCQGLRRGIPTWIEALFVQDAPKVWAVVGVYGTESGPSELPRILDSVRIKHKP